MKKSSPSFEKILANMAQQGLIEPRTENNKYLKLSYKGTDGLVSPKWNIKIYTTNMIVCTDMEVVKAFHEGKLITPDPSLKLIQIDDAGWGFPLCGILIGLQMGKRVITGEIPVSFFKPGIFETKKYLQVYSDIGYGLLQKEFQATPQTHRVEICTGFINSRLRDVLRKEGYDVRAVEIKGLLQNSLENLFKKYVYKELGAHLAYDVKELTKKKLSFEYYKALDWGRRNAPGQIKSGWKSLQESNHPLQQTELFKYLEERTMDE